MIPYVPLHAHTPTCVDGSTEVVCPANPMAVEILHALHKNSSVTTHLRLVLSTSWMPALILVPAGLCSGSYDPNGLAAVIFNESERSEKEN